MDPALFMQYLTYAALGLCAVDDVHGNMVGVSLSPPHLQIYKLWLAVRWEVCGLPGGGIQTKDLPLRVTGPMMHFSITTSTPQACFQIPFVN